MTGITQEDIDLWFGHPGFEGSEHPLAGGREEEPPKVTDLATAYAAALRNTKNVIDSLDDALSPDGEAELRAEVRKRLPDIQDSLIRLITSTYNAALALKNFNAEYEKAGEEQQALDTQD